MSGEGADIATPHTASLQFPQVECQCAACLLDKAGRQTFYASYEAWVPPLRRYLRRESYRLANWLNGRAPAWAAGENGDAD